MAGAARRGWVSSVKARYGVAGEVWLGIVRYGLVWQVWQGEVGSGMVRYGKVWQAWKAKNRKELFFYGLRMERLSVCAKY